MSPPIPRIGLHVNGNGNGDGGDDEADLTRDERIDRMLDRTLELYTFVAEIRTAAIRSEESAKRCEQAADRIEASLARAHGADRLDAARARLESLSTIDDDDPTNVRILKEEVHRLRGAVGKIEDAETAALRARAEKAEALLAKANDKQADRAEWWTRHKLTILVGIPAAVATTILGAYLLASLHIPK